MRPVHDARVGAIYTSDWVNTSGGDGFHAEIDPDDWRIVYTESQPDRQGGNVGRYEHRDARDASRSVRTRTTSSNWQQYITPAMEDLAEKQNWGRQPQMRRAAPVQLVHAVPCISPHNSKTLYIGANHLLMSPDRA